MPGLWSVDGIYYDREDVPHAQSGQLLVSHSPNLWTIDSQLKISGEDQRDFISRYELNPMAQGQSHTDWKSHTGGPEPIFGLFVVVEDCLMMPWQSQTGAYWGQEVLAFRKPDEYISRGFAFIKETKVSAWAVRMTRQSGPESD
jgi:hypothetical protein